MKSQIKFGAVLTYFSLFIGNAIALFYTPFMLRSLGQNEYGLFSLANAIVGYLTVLDFGFGSATIRYTAKYKAENNIEKAQSMYGMFIVLYLLIGIITFLIGLFIAIFAESIFKNGLSIEEIKTIKILLILASINLAVSFPFGVFTSIITAYEKFIFLKIMSMLRLLLNPLTFVPLLLLGYKSIGLIAASSILNILFLIINLIYCFTKLKIKIIFKKFDFVLLKEIINYSIWIFVGSIVNQLWWNSGQFLLGVFSSSASIALYGLAMQFKTYFESFATAISGVFLPRMTTMVSENASDSDFTEYFVKVGRIQFIIIALITTGFIIFGKQFICCWAGTEYIKSFYATLIIFIPLSLVDTQTLGITILQAKNKHKFRSLLYLCVAIACIILCIPFIKIFDLYGCAAATAIALTIGNLFIINWYYHKKIGLNIILFWKEVLKIFPGVILVSVASGIAIHFLPELDSYRLLLPAMLIYIILYFIVLYFVSFNSYEKGLVQKINPLKRGKNA